MRLPGGDFRTVLWSPDGRTLATRGGLGDQLGLWDVRTHKPLGRLGVELAPFPGTIAMSPDGRTLAYPGEGNTVGLTKSLLWRDLAELERDVCGLVGRGLTRQEWARYAGGVPYRRTCR